MIYIVGKILSAKKGDCRQRGSNMFHSIEDALAIEQNQTMESVKTLPVLPMRIQTVFPKASLTFDVGRAASVNAVDRARREEDLIFLIKQKDGNVDEPTVEDLFRVGTVAHVDKGSRLPNGRVRLGVTGRYRARVRKFIQERDCLYAEVEILVCTHGDLNTEEAYRRSILELARQMSSAPEGRLSPEAAIRFATAEDAEDFTNACAQYLRLKEGQKQSILEESDLLSRLQTLYEAMLNEQEIAEIEQRIGQSVRKSIEKSQKEYYLREQIKAIHTELGDSVEESETLKEKMLAKGLPKEVEEKAMQELARMDKMPPSSPEYTVLRNYADWLLDLPWKEESEDTASLATVEKILNADHYGLEKIKERVVEYLAVLKLTGKLNAPILCLVGPPGVGKTSIAKSIARAMGRKFVRMSLGGLKDEAEIRGHRRTYIGAMPGRIIYEMKNAGTVNPVFLLDEVDKISADLRGDPSSALLEVLDPAQNSTYRDRYLEVAYDLSKVMFIATANTLDTIPAPLRDRMEIIELSGYTPQEKEEIAKRYLVPKKREENGLTAEKLTFSPTAISAIIDGYTMESGVRSLERTIGTVCRKAAVRIAKGEEAGKVTITKSNLEKFLGAKRYSRDGKVNKTDEVGAVAGLAWTAVGGTTLTVEVSTMQGKGELRLTGKLGEVMKESAQTAWSYLHAHAKEWGILEELFETQDVHVHVPEGATPKDGPSAGITMATAMLSALTGKAVRKDVAMTGEITLRGKVLPIGGLKEKSLAAHRAGITNVIIPKDNEKDLEEIPLSVRGKLNFICVSDVKEVFQHALVGGRRGN